MATNPKCANCGSPFPATRSFKKFCSDQCRHRHNVQMAINRIKELTVTIAEAARETGLPEDVVRDLIRIKRIDKFNLDSRIRIRRSDALRLRSS